MFDFKEKLEEYGFTIETYEAFLKDCTDKTLNISDLNWEQIVRKHNVGFNPDTVRKGAQPPIIGSVFVSEYYKWKEQQKKANSDDDYLKEIKAQQQELIKERYKLQAEKTELTRQLRQQSRFELFYENISREINQLKPPTFNLLPPDSFQEEYILTIADIHAGARFETETNHYSLQECTRRFNILYNHMVCYIEKNEISKLKILCLGDDIQGILRLSDLQLNESSVVEATVFVAKTISSFLNQLSKFCEIDYYHCPTSNHSQLRPLGTKASELATEDVEYVIANYIQDVLINNERITIHTNHGSEYIEIPIFHYNAIALHGHQIRNIDATLKDFSYKKKKFYDIAFLAHFHGAKETIVGEGATNDTEVLICPSFIGTCPYADKIMKGAKPSCKVFVFNREYGHTDSHKIILT